MASERNANLLVNWISWTSSWHCNSVSLWSKRMAAQMNSSNVKSVLTACSSDPHLSSADKANTWVKHNGCVHNLFMATSHYLPISTPTSTQGALFLWQLDLCICVHGQLRPVGNFTVKCRLDLWEDGLHCCGSGHSQLRSLPIKVVPFNSLFKCDMLITHNIRI